MKVSKSPTIVTQFWGPELAAAAAKAREVYDSSPLDGGELRKLAADVWALDKPVRLHKDKTLPGFWVFGVVLINDPGLLLFDRNVIYDLPVGTVYSIDGRRLHGALAHNCVKPGLFAFMAWDVPRNTPVDELIQDVAPSMLAWSNGEERINVYP